MFAAHSLLECRTFGLSILCLDDTTSHTSSNFFAKCTPVQSQYAEKECSYVLTQDGLDLVNKMQKHVSSPCHVLLPCPHRQNNYTRDYMKTFVEPEQEPEPEEPAPEAAADEPAAAATEAPKEPAAAEAAPAAEGDKAEEGGKHLVQYL